MIIFGTGNTESREIVRAGAVEAAVKRVFQS